ncbi:MAG TPA: cupin domain-containing protein [Terriglobales bacterium]|nr:cupin domain-containing protein [Terriglobales bacterium]
MITGRDGSGKSIFARDELVEPQAVMGFEFHRLWGSDDPANLPTDGKEGVPRMYFPEPGGYRFGYFVIPPRTDAIPPEQFLAALPELQQKVPGLLESLEPQAPGMHTTQTVDFDVVVSGEVWLELDDGKEVLLKAGDCVVQNGTRHAWHNRSAEKCVMAVCLLGALSQGQRLKEQRP